MKISDIKFRECIPTSLEGVYAKDIAQETFKELIEFKDLNEQCVFIFENIACDQTGNLVDDDDIEGTVASMFIDSKRQLANAIVEVYLPKS